MEKMFYFLSLSCLLFAITSAVEEEFLCPAGEYLCFYHHPITREFMVSVCSQAGDRAQRLMLCEENLRCYSDLHEPCVPYEVPFSPKGRLDLGTPFKVIGKGVGSMGSLAAMGGLGAMKKINDYGQKLGDIGKFVWNNIKPIWQFDL